MFIDVHLAHSLTSKTIFVSLDDQELIFFYIIVYVFSFQRPSKTSHDPGALVPASILRVNL